MTTRSQRIDFDELMRMLTVTGFVALTTWVLASSIGVMAGYVAVSPTAKVRSSAVTVKSAGAVALPAAVAECTVTGKPGAQASSTGKMSVDSPPVPSIVATSPTESEGKSNGASDSESK